MRKFLTLGILTFVILNLTFGREDPLKKRTEEFFFGKTSAAGVTQTVVNANNITSWLSVISSPGGLGWPPLIKNSWNGTFPRGSGVGMIYREGLMIGGIVNDGGPTSPRVQGIFYRTSLRPGKIITKGQAEDFNSAAVKRVWRVRPDYRTADLKADAAEYFMKSLKDVTSADEEAIRQQYENDWKDWPADKGAPWYTTTGPDAYKVKYGPGFNPNDPTHVPGIPGATQTVWTVGNDLDATLGQTVFNSVNIGLEVQVTEWCYSVSNPLNNIIFQQFRIIYKGTATTPSNATIDSMYVVKWSDPDLGDYSDDLAGCDSVLGLGYVYNSNTVDAEYQAIGLPAPAVGFDFLQGPAYYTGNPNDSAVIGLQWRKGYKYWNENPLSAFVFFAAGTGISDPTNATQWFNLMKAGLPRPEWPAYQPFWSAFVRDPNVYPTKYAVAGDPVTKTGWIDGREIPPGDRRIVPITGPFRMSLGDTAEIVVALIGAMGVDNLSSVQVLKYYDTYAQFAYDNLFVLPSPPPSPNVKVAQLDRQIVLNWGWDQNSVNAIENFNSAGFVFEGYNVYQLPSPTSSLSEAVKIATYDVVNDVTVILDRTIDPKTGALLMVPVQTGSNSGIRHFISLTTDYIRQRPLVNGQTYYYAVTAYAYNPDPLSPFRALESTPVVIATVPQSPPPGTRYFGAVGDTLQVTHKGKSDGEVVAILVDPSATTGHTYEVRFDNSGNWFIVDVNQNRVKATGSNQSGDEAYPVVDGIFVKVMGPPLAGKEWLVTQGAADRWFTAAPSAHGELLFGGAYLGPNFTGSSVLPGDFKSVEIRFTSKTSYDDANNNGLYDLGEKYYFDITKGQKAFFYRTWSNDTYEGFLDVPFQVYDIENPNSPRQLNVVVRDRNANRQWDISDPAEEVTPYEYVWILDDTYDPTGKAWDPTQGRGFMTNGSNHSAYPVLWALWLGQRGTREPYGADVTIQLIPNRVNTPADTFRFTTQAPTVGDVQLAAQDVEKINAFPNPYYGFNLMESSRLNKYITFNHLPKKATIRIFNLAGVLVKTIYKDDDTQFARWNLRNERNMPVASGIYIVHIDMPEIGKTKILKLLIVQEEEIIPTY